jgi:hypothetical protein
MTNPIETNDRIRQIVAEFQPMSRETEDMTVRLNRVIAEVNAGDAWGVAYDSDRGMWVAESEDNIREFEPGTTEAEITVWIVRTRTEEIPY